MNNTFNNIPFLRITFAFASGIYIASVFPIQNSSLIYVALLLTGCLIIIHKRYSYKLSPIFGIISFVLILLFGAITYKLHNRITINETYGTMSATVLETPQARNNSYKSLLLLSGINTEDTLIGTHEKLLVYFEKSEKIQHLKPGSEIIFNQKPQQIKNQGNPYEFDYKKYLANKHIFRQVYLKTENWSLTGQNNNSALIWAELTREKLLNIYRDQDMGETETEILSALTLGYKRELKRETKRVFSSAGAMHVLAVSGLHVGILFFTFSFCFGFLQKQKTGRLAYVILSITFLWCYAFITGFSPSVLRASTMFSLIIIASNINRRANIYNTLAASACLLLLINPNNLFEVGFQLSYTAVFGIVFLQPRLAGLWPIQNKIALFFWNLVTVSVSAQVATFPLSAYYFNQFPTYFLFSNLVVIPAAMLLIPLGLALLAFSQIPVLATSLSFLIKWIIKSVYFTLSSIELLPKSTFDVTIQQSELFFIIAILFSIFLFIGKPRAIFLKYTLAFGTLLFALVLFSGYKQINQRQIIVLNAEQPVTCFIKGQKMYAISNDTLLADNYIYSAVQNIKRQDRISHITFLNAQSSFRDHLLLLENGLVVFEGRKVVLNSNNNASLKKISPDIIVASTKSNNITKPVLDSCFIIKYYPQWEKFAPHKNHHILSTQGAFISSW